MTDFFDGIKADPQKVSPSVHAEGILLDQRLIPWQQIQDVRKVAQSWHLTLSQQQLIITDDADFAAQVLSSWAIRQSTIRRFSLWWSALRLRNQILLGIGIATLFGTGILLGFLQLYHLVPLRYDRHLGDKTHEQVSAFFEPCTTNALLEFHQKAIRSLAQPGDRFPHEVTIINDPMVNAFALPGGHIYVFRGILEESNSPDEIIGVLAHEIAHVEKRHSVQQLARTMGTGFFSSLMIGADVEGLDILQNAETISEISSTLLILRYSRSFEREADEEGIQRMQSAHIPLLGLGQLLVRIESRAGVDSGWVWLSTHPKSWERLERYKVAEKKLPTRDVNPAFAEERRLWPLLKQSCPEAQNVRKRLGF